MSQDQPSLATRAATLLAEYDDYMQRPEGDRDTIAADDMMAEAAVVALVSLAQSMEAITQSTGLRVVTNPRQRWITGITPCASGQVDAPQDPSVRIENSAEAPS